MATEDSGASCSTDCPGDELQLKDGKLSDSVLNSNRKCPYDMAACYHLGDTEVGPDGQMWIVKQRTNGVKYWKRMKVVD